MKNLLTGYTISELLVKYPFIKDFFNDHLVPFRGHENLTIKGLFKILDYEVIEENAINEEVFCTGLVEYVELMKSYFVTEENTNNTITIYPGTHKDGSKEKFDSISISSGEIVSIVGPTGSGKSRLLADIEWAANNDTPTSRIVHINGRSLEPHERFSSSNKLVAQLSQNMNFVMDMTVGEFLDLHATSRLVENKEEVVSEDKIVLMSTHDPILALMGDKRIVINNGGIDKILDVTEEEKSILGELEEMDRKMMMMRNKLRYGKKITLEEEK